jgi:hypothetical protein
VVTSSTLLPIKANDPLLIPVVHTQASSSGEYTFIRTVFLRLTYISAHIAKWVAESNRPANITNDPELINLLTTGHHHLKVPSPATVRRDITAAYLKCRERISKLLQDHPGRVHFATDAWTSTNHYAFVAWTVHLEHDGVMLAFLLDIVEVPVSHTGVALARAFQKMLTTFGLQDRVSSWSNITLSNSLYLQILAMVADNATSNNTQGEALDEMDNSFVLEHRVRCFNHTLQLSAKTLLRPFNVGLGKATEYGDDNDGDDLLDPETGGDDNNNNDNNDNDNDNDSGEDDDDDDDMDDADDIDDGIDELDALDPDAREEVMTDTVAVRDMVTKRRRLAFAIVRSTTIALPAWRCHCKELNLKPRLLPRDVVTRWNSTYYMLDFAIKYRTVIDAMTADKSLKLRKFELEMEEWTIAEDLVAVLLQYKNATLFFSQDSASVAAVIPAMDRISNHLNYKTGKAYHPSIAVAMKLARKKMDRYYSLTDSSTTYRIAMVLHPGMKLEYFRNHQWKGEWIKEAERLVREEYIARYEKVANESNMKPANTKNSKTTNDGGIASFGDLSVTTAPRASEIQEYLNYPVENVKDPLKWWVDNQHAYPNLHRMALDYLSIPGKYGILTWIP